MHQQRKTLMARNSSDITAKTKAMHDVLLSKMSNKFVFHVNKYRTNRSTQRINGTRIL